MPLLFMIEIAEDQLQIMRQHGEHTYPEECCGILLGKVVGDRKIVVEVIPTINAWRDGELAADVSQQEKVHSKRDRYIIPPQQILQAQKTARDRGLDIIGFFHSHPDYPAMPSECDHLNAWDIYVYAIVSVMEGKATTVNSWVLDERGLFQPELIADSGS
jgi:proteasome lid subunit RPN8/RPN11